ncbi:hypothetical protein ALP14_05556 [Pseudomonas amygdali pv. myricae]|nr:hypothetical protein ALP18_200239 [Pseudomonas amygdali pv. myricae]RMV29818.1 hypothetical protein ALP14_05556 [Pseudomonas amygdali pv. myricae]
MQARTKVLGHGGFGQTIHHPTFGDSRQVRHAGIAGNAVTQHQAGVLAVFGGVGQPKVNGLAHGAHIDFPAFQTRRAAKVSTVGAAEHAHGQFGTAGPHEPGNADDLATPYMETNIADTITAGLVGVPDRPAFDLEQHLADIWHSCGIAVRQLPPDHGADHPCFVDGFGTAVDDIHRPAVANHRDFVRYPSDLVEFVRNNDGGDAASLELQHQCQQSVAVLFIQAGCGLVKNQQAHIFGQRLGDLDHLLLADTQASHKRLGRHFQPHAVEQFAGAPMRPVPVDHAAGGYLVAQKKVFGHRQHWHQGQLLVNDANAQGLAVAQIVEGARLTVEEHLTLEAAVRIHTAENFHQG